ncbi:hypothetical protein M4I32_14435 [Microbacterium sp. LRZ72]|uniref:hypothetical protein n=1 Tax=Microbacterium sp. LRZ72 TaxID=2942481 RepID=UPI0029B72D84|nr:hypothetical protein [Microbacterium sp. LRZ72]MDX2377992.1 hypothetical protein [Microbacterium sp. LRZ72]
MIPLEQTHVGLTQMAVTTTCAVLVIGLGFTSRPSREYLLWSFGFLLALLSSYATLTASMTGDAERLRVFGLGLLLGVPALFWSGLRAQRTVRAHAWAGPVLAIALGTLLAAAAESWTYPIAFRTAFLVAGCFAGLCAYELSQGRRRHSRFATPMFVVSLAFLGIAIVSFVAGVVLLVLGLQDDMAATRALNSLGVIVYTMCTTVTILTLSNDRRSAGAIVSDPRAGAVFHTVASDRLSRARERDERAWSLVELRLDDIDDVREAAGEVGFRAIQARLIAAFGEAFPAVTDIGDVGDGILRALVPESPSAVRRRLHGFLDEISQTRRDLPLTVRLTASAGVASPAENGFELDPLAAAAHQARLHAVFEGGNRVGTTRPPQQAPAGGVDVGAAD